MTTYEAVPNTDGQILIPVGKKLAVAPQHKFPRTLPPPRRPPASGVPASKYRVQARPQSPPTHSPVRRSAIRSASQQEASRPQQSQASKNNLRKRLELRQAASSQWTAVNSSTGDAQATNSDPLNHRFKGSIPEPVITKDEIPIKTNDQVNADRMNLSYIMKNQLDVHTLRPIRGGKEKNVIDVIVSLESDEDNYEDEDKDEEMPLVHRNDVHTRYPSFPTHNRLNTQSYPNAKYLLNNPDITASLQESVLNSPMEFEDIERGRNLEFDESAGVAKIAPSRADCRLPHISTIGATHSQSHLNMKAPSPSTSPHINQSSTNTSKLNTLGHAAITTLACLKSTLDSDNLNSSTTYSSSLSPNKSWPSKENLQTSNLKRPSTFISTPIRKSNQLPESISRASLPSTGLEPATKRLRISSLLNPASSHVSPASATPQNQITNIIHTKTPIHRPNKLANDSGNDKLITPPSSSTYPSPPISPSYVLPQPPLSSTPSINPQSQFHLLFFNNEAYSPLPPASPLSLSLPRSSSAPLIPTSTSTSQSYSPSPPPPSPTHRHSTTHKNLTYRAWKLRPSSSHSTLTNPSPSHTPQYLILIRQDDHSKTPHTHNSNSSNTDTAENMGKWWTILNGREEMEEIRKIFE
ncbi:predicted protein [Sclerotinia sclerotiorum 1980 UF-70]|uniref:Uncharacterized protein n=2 Tax=Sclerotinia sclerotiorum (strain ATCC 18683 / 1980 / Ss-1) TaxID=665079 RepID=A7E5T5_SCLS1|nr:predicted protein [Sclerotinia sclerotiorum 1980 UF-70]APA07755.1 hypothetical protein sscle_03g025250 [Sclerotinia sclerotiorum 1980 UF-70]EDN91257.1 predicted protein [Sclerotinia sclerotiorum 1980 UF-70]